LGIGEASTPLQRVRVTCRGQQTAFGFELGAGCAKGGFEKDGEMVDNADRVDGSKRRGRNAVRPQARGRQGGRNRFHFGRCRSEGAGQVRN
jgi:hypothetical protein